MKGKSKKFGRTTQAGKPQKKPNPRQSFSGISINDSQSINRNNLICTGIDQTSELGVQLSSKQIGDFLSQISIERENGEEKMVRRINEMEQRDAVMFAEIMQKDRENAEK
ncbi:hypothetical protein Ancab_015172, partial [Ancistrocladus abbreviatus]